MSAPRALPPFPSLSAIIPRYNAHCFAILTTGFAIVRVVKRVVVRRARVEFV